PRVIAPGDRPRLYVFDRVTGRSRWVAGTPASQDHDPTLMKFSDDGATLVVSWLSFDTPVTTGAVTVHRVGDFAEQQLIRFPGLGAALDVDRTGRRLAISYSRSGRLGFDQTLDAAVYDRVSGRLRIASVAADGSPGNDTSVPGGITPDGRVVVMASSASNLAPGDRPGDEVYGSDCLVATFPPRT
ncbi:MAG TPA: hypothetical protein VFJ97_13265, partial [Dermatophilaceae bacterium]|nr:hypothetical protein [Dermatophilaceae bacterium]